MQKITLTVILALFMYISGSYYCAGIKEISKRNADQAIHFKTEKVKIENDRHCFWYVYDKDDIDVMRKDNVVYVRLYGGSKPSKTTTCNGIY